MTLRSRFTLLVTALLTLVLAGAGIVVERLESARVDASIDHRVLDLADGPSSVLGSLCEPPPPPPPPRDRGPAMDGDGHPGEPSDDDAERPPPWADGSHPPPPPPPPPDEDDGPPMGGDERAKADATSVRTLATEPDGAHAEVFVFNLPRVESESARLRAHAASGAPEIDEGVARSWIALAKQGEVERTTIGARVYAVTAALSAAPRGPGDGHPPHHGGHGGHGPRGDKPPPAPPKAVAVAFLDSGPARAAHLAQSYLTGAVALGALLFGSVLASALAGRMLRPIRAAAAAAESIASPSQRLPTRGSADELERLVVVLNAMLARLDETNVRERHFLATASHELRRPLTALLGELELASAPGRDPAALRSSVALALGDGRAMRRLVEDLLHHARAQAGALRLTEADVALADVVADAVARSRRTLANGTADGNGTPNDKPVGSPPLTRIEVGALPAVTLRADPDALRQALENLIVNGATHGGAGATVRIAAESVAAGLTIRVEDDGPGIPSDELARLFEPFGRGDRARTVPGFGLGLAITRDIVLAHGATIDAVSPIDAGAARPGARFTVHWPSARIVVDA